MVGTTWAWKVFFGRFLLRLSRIKRPQVMSMVKFSPIALNFGYDFVLLVHFLGHPVLAEKDDSDDDRCADDVGYCE